MKKSWYYSIMFFMTCIWYSVVDSRSVKDLLLVLGIVYLIDMVASVWRGE